MLKTKNRSQKILMIGLLLLVLCLFFFVYLHLCYSIKRGSNDLRIHIRIALETYQEGNLSIMANFFHLAILTLSGFTNTVRSMILSLSFLLASATTLRFYLLYKEINSLSLIDEKKNYKLTILLAFSLLFVLSIPLPILLMKGYLYFGTFTPTVWHNPTTILLFPFAFLLFLQSYKQMQNYSVKRDLSIFVLIILNILIKPSFFFVFITVYPLMMLYQHKFTKTFWLSLSPLFFGGLFLLLKYIVLYEQGAEGDGSGIGISPFFMYKVWQPLWTFPLTLFFSLAFPIVYGICNYKNLRTKKDYCFALFLQIPSFIIYIFIIETGPRMMHGNFYWQTVVSIWILFFVSFKYLLIDIKRDKFTKKNKYLLALYTIHCLFGLIYFVHSMMGNVR